MDTPVKANDKYRASLRATFIDGVDTTIQVTAIPPNLPTLVTIGWDTDFETVFRVEGTSGTNASNYALTGITKIKGYSGNLPENTAVNCLNNEEFFNQYSTAILTAAGLKALIFADDTAANDTYIAAIDPFPDAYDDVQGVPLTFMPATSNTGAATLNINGIGAGDIKKYSGGSLSDVATGDLIANGIYILVWDGDRFLLQNPSGAAASSDWTAYTAVTPTTGTFDAPSFPIVFAGVDLTAVIKPGMRVKITQATDKFFLVTKVAFSTDTTVTLYGGTDFTLVASGTTAISAFSYSTAKAPVGFNTDPAKWTETATTTGGSESSPASGTWFNKGGSLAIPIGVWNVTHQGMMTAQKNSATSVEIYSTLHTANNAEGGLEWRCYAAIVVGSANLILNVPFTRENQITLTSKTTYFSNVMSTSTAGSIGLQDSGPGTSKVIIKAVSAYL